MSIWSQPSAVDELKRRHAEGASAGDLAFELGRIFNCFLSRNAVCGKLARLGLTAIDHPAKPPKPKPARRERFRTASTRRPPAMLPDVTREATEVVELLPDTDIPQAQRRTIFELENHHCRFPVAGEGVQTEFCGGLADVSGGQSWCSQHAPRCFTNSRTYTDSQQRWLRKRFAG